MQLSKSISRSLSRSIARGISGGGGMISQDFAINSNLSSWITKSNAIIENGNLVINPILDDELYADSSLEGDYIDGVCSSITIVNTVNAIESSDSKTGNKAQQFTPLESGGGIVKRNVVITSNWYNISAQIKKITEYPSTMVITCSNGTGTEMKANKYIQQSDNNYVKYVCPFLFLGTNLYAQTVINSNTTITPFNTVIVDDISCKKIILNTLAIYKKCTAIDYAINILVEHTFFDGLWRGTAPFGTWICVDNPDIPQNGILVVTLNSSKIYIIKYKSGVPTLHSIISTSLGTSNSIGGVRNGDKYTIMYGNMPVGGEITINDIGTCEYVGIFSSHSENTFRFFDFKYSKNIKNIFFYGDSKTASTIAPCHKMPSEYILSPEKIGIGGTTVAARAANIAIDLQNLVGIPNYIVINLGTNDFPQNSQTWKEDYNTIISAMHTKWPNALIGCVAPWKPGSDIETDVRYTDLTEIIADKLYCSLAYNEFSWLENGDGGATYISSDNVHPNKYGYFQCALALREWLTNL